MLVRINNRTETVQMLIRISNLHLRIGADITMSTFPPKKTKTQKILDKPQKFTRKNTWKHPSFKSNKMFDFWRKKIASTFENF